MLLLGRPTGRSSPANRRPQSADDISEALSRSIEEVRPALRLSNYRLRFAWGGSASLPTVQEPYIEFLLLLYIVAESGRSLRPDEIDACGCAQCGQAQRARAASGPSAMRSVSTSSTRALQRRSRKY